MKVAEAQSEYLKHEGTPYQFVEKVGRTCYKSEENMTTTSAVSFVEGLVARDHWAMLEHAWLHIRIGSIEVELHEMFDVHEKFLVKTVLGLDTIISGSFRAFYESHFCQENKNVRYYLQQTYPEVFGVCEEMDFRKSLHVEELSDEETIELMTHKKCKKEIIMKHIPHTVKFTCDRGVSHEFVRHRTASFAQESTRYCNYTKGKFGSEITVIRPIFYEKGTENYNIWENAMLEAEKNYNALIENGCKPQEARSVLPTSLKTELIVTASEEEWQHIINLRHKGTTGAPHPQIVQSMDLIVDDLIKNSGGRLA